MRLRHTAVTEAMQKCRLAIATTIQTVDVAYTNAVMPPIFSVSIKQESCLYILNWLLVLLADYDFRLLDKAAWDKRKRAAEVLIESTTEETAFAITISKNAEGCTIGVFSRASPESASMVVQTSLVDLLKAAKRYTANPHYVVMHSFQKELVLNSELPSLQQSMNSALEQCHWQKVGLDSNASIFEATKLFSSQKRGSRLRFFAAMESTQGRSKVTTWVTTYSADLTKYDCQQAASELLGEFQRRSERNQS